MEKVIQLKRDLLDKQLLIAKQINQPLLVDMLNTLLDYVVVELDRIIQSN